MHHTSATSKRLLLCASFSLMAALILCGHAHAATPLPPMPMTVTKVLGTTRQEEIMLNRIVPYAGSHLGGVHVDTSATPNRFYVFDSANNRVLGFNGFKEADPDAENYPGADIVIGQPTLWDAGAANGDNTHFLQAGADTLAFLPFPYVSSTMEAPRSGTMATDTNGNFFVVDLCNNRILKFNDPFATDQIADKVWGQTNFTDRARGTTATNLRTDWNYGTTIGAFSAGVDVEPDGTVWVADSFNNRVLRFPPGSSTANLVLGQTSFTSSGSGTGLNQMYHPTSVHRHPVTGDLYVLDGQNWPASYFPRILVFKPPFSTGMFADREFGKQTGGQRTGLHWARGFCFDPDNTNIVWVADGGNNRILKIDSYSGALLDAIGPKSVSDTGHSYYQRPNGDMQYMHQPDADIGFDSAGNLYFTCVGGFTPVVRIPLPLQRNASGYVIASGEMMKDGMNQVSGMTFNDFYGMSHWKNQLYVSDRNRVLVWTNFTRSATFEQADFVIGQSSMDKNEPGGTFEGRHVNLHTTGSNFLFVATSYKLFIFTLPITGGGRDYAPLKTYDSGAGHIKWADDNQPIVFHLNGGLVYDEIDNCLWVGDRDHCRVLRIRDPLTTPRVDMVLGQTDKSGSDMNHGLGLWSTDAQGLAALWSLHLDNYRNLYVVDSGYEGRTDNSGNLRVVRYDYTNTVPDPSNIFPFPPACAVFGKPNLTTSRIWSESHRPHTPISLAFSPSNQMVMLCDSYGNSQGELIFFYDTPHIGTNPQPSRIIDTYFGQPATAFFDGDSVIFQDHTWNRILFHTPSSTAPYVDITNRNATMKGATSTGIGGTNNANVVGTMTWANDQGGQGAFPAAASWAAEEIPLILGPNLITVVGTNQHGVVASDTATIVRDYALAFVDITNSSTDVDIDTTSYTIGGTNNEYVVGGMWWANTSTSGIHGAFAAAPDWVIPDIALTFGTNVIEVHGSNLVGQVASDSIVIGVVPEGAGSFLLFAAGIGTTGRRSKGVKQSKCPIRTKVSLL